MVLRTSKAGGGTEVSWEIVHRSGLCEKCRTRLEDFDTGKINTAGRPVTIVKCPQCGGGLGELIAAQRKRGRWFLYFFGNWDKQRVDYCERHRYEELPVGFRLGGFSAATMLFTINLKLKGEWNGL